MSDSNRIRISIVQESSFGVLPTSPAWKVIPTTGQSLRDRIGYQQSQTINNDRNVQDLVRLSKAAGGGIPVELTYASVSEGLSLLIQGAFANTYYDLAGRTETLCTTTAGAKTITKAGIDFADETGLPSDGNVAIGDIVKVSGSTGGADDGYYKVTNVAATTLTVEADANFTGSTGDVTVYRAPRLVNGTAQTTYSIEVARLDLQIAQVFTGCAIDTMSLSVADEAITTANFTVNAASSTFYTSAVSTDVFQTGATYTAATVNPVLDSISVPEIRSGGSAYAAKSIGMDLRNNTAPRTQIGSLGAQSMRWGEFGASGSVAAYLETFTDLQAYANNTETDLWFILIDANGKGYSLSFPRVKYSDAGADVSGSNTDVLANLSATALKDTTELVTARWQRWE